MNVLRLAALLIYTFGAFAYGALLSLLLREVREAANAREPSPAAVRTWLVSGALWSVSFAWFIVNALNTLVSMGSMSMWPLDMAGLWLALAFPPLIAHMTWAEVVETRIVKVSPAWGVPVWPMYVVACASALAATVGFAGVGGVPGHVIGRWITIVIAASFVATSMYCIALITTYPAPGNTMSDRQSSWWHLVLFGLMILMFPLIFTMSDRNAATAILGGLLEICLKSLPLAFMFVGTYFEHRFEFFDLFVKRGLSLGVTTAVLALSFAAALPLLHRYNGSWTAPFVYAVVLLPIAMALPWLHGWIGRVLDRRWLGRGFGTVEAVKHFLGGLRSATTEEQLIDSAQAGLSRIFDAPAAVRLESRSQGPLPEFDIVEDVKVRAGAGIAGRFLMGKRRSDAPYFSEDVALLTSLADVFASVLDNLHLQKREQEQDRRAQELSLHASRSELRALRAQINPHFFFNALNAIASLIHQDPAVADRTIEKLADVFRYALRGAESEWAVLDDELEFARAYLEVEQARFGSRLQTEVRMAEEARGALVPTMVVQTLVENAVKHGAAAVKGRATVRIDARREGERVHVAVADNGPGFDAAGGARAPGARRDSGGYGLFNVRQRLEGHFGSSASLTIDRDVARGLTVVRLTLPFVREEPRAVPSAAGAEVHR